MAYLISLIIFNLFLITASYAQGAAASVTIPGPKQEETIVSVSKRPANLVAKDYVGQGIAYRSKGDHQNAIQCFNKAIEIDPEYAEAYECRALSYGYSQIGKYDKAISDFDKAIQLEPDNKDYYFGRALMYYYKQDFNKTWTDIRKAEQLGFKVPQDFMNELTQASTINRTDGKY